MKPNAAPIQRTSDGAGTRTDSHWPEILASAQDRDVRPTEFLRLILIEMSAVCGELRAVSEHSSLEFKLKPLLAQVHALRTLAETTRHATELAVQTDVVNLDGPKFFYVAKVWLEVFKESVLASGCSDHVWGSVLRFFRDNMTKQEPEIRRKMKEMTDFPEGAEESLWPKKPSNESVASSAGDTAADRSTT